MNKIEIGKKLVELVDKQLKEDMHPKDYEYTYGVRKQIDKLKDEDYESIVDDAVSDLSAMFR